jgi:hypothetical protein
MKPFRTIEGHAAPLLEDNIDTDVIVRIERIARLKRGEFAAWAFEAAALVLAFFITSLRLTEFSGKGNPSVEAGRFLHRVLVDEAFDRLIEHPLLDRRFLRFAGQCAQSRELRKSRLAQSGGTRLPRSHD